MTAEPPTPTWTITKPEWDGFVLKAARAVRTLKLICVASAVFGIGFLFGATLAPKQLQIPLLFLGGMMLVSAAITVFAKLRNSQRAAQVMHDVWDSSGCVCPWCAVRVDKRPCARHGLSRSDQPMLLRYWEAVVTERFGEMARIAAEISSRGKTRVAGRLLARWSSIAMTAVDQEAPRGKRMAAAAIMAVPGIVIFFVAMSILGGGGRHAIPLEMAIGFPAAMLAMIAMTRRLRPPELHCTKCSQLCATPPPAVCTECGADLTKPGSLSRVRKRRFRWLIEGAVVFAVVVGVTFGLPRAMALLPVSAQCWVYSGPFNTPPFFFERLASPTLSPSDAKAAADLLLSLAAPGGPRTLIDWNFLDNALKLGILRAEYLEKAARTIVQATLEVGQDGNATVVTVHPAFGTNIIGGSQTPRLVFGGISVDGGAWTAPAGWSLFREDLDEFWREHGQLPPLRESKLRFTTRIEGLAPGAHTVRARCWIVLWGARWERLVPAFGSGGEFLPPSGARAVYPIELEMDMKVAATKSPAP